MGVWLKCSCISELHPCRKLRRSNSGVVVINICISLLGLYIVFILSAQAPQLNTHNPPHGANLCALFSALFQYFALAFFCLSVVEALLLLTELTVVLKIKYFLAVSLTVAWRKLNLFVFCLLCNYYLYGRVSCDNWFHPIKQSHELFYNKSRVGVPAVRDQATGKQNRGNRIDGLGHTVCEA